MLTLTNSASPSSRYDSHHWLYSDVRFSTFIDSTLQQGYTLTPRYENETPQAFALHPTESIIAVAYTQWLTDGSRDGAIRLLDMHTGKELKLLEGDIHEMTDLAFSPDGNLLASASYDGTVRLWGIPSEP